MLKNADLREMYVYFDNKQNVFHLMILYNSMIGYSWSTIHETKMMVKRLAAVNSFFHWPIFIVSCNSATTHPNKIG